VLIRKYTVLTVLIDAMVIRDKEITIPAHDVEKAEINIVRTICKGEYHTSIAVNKRVKTANERDLGENAPYFFKGEKARVQRRGREDALTYLEYSGTGYLFKYKGIEFILIPLYPHISTPK